VSDTEWLALLKLSHESRRVVLEAGYRADSCILSAKVVHEVLRVRGRRARPITVRWVLMNTAYLDHLEEIAAADWSRELYPDAWSVGIGYGEDVERPGEPMGWAGHLAVLTDSGYLVDPAVDQGTRTTHGIVAEPMCLPLPDGLIPPEGLAVTLRQGWARLYRSPRAVPKRARDWVDPAKYRELVDQVLAHEGLAHLMGEGPRPGPGAQPPG